MTNSLSFISPENIFNFPGQRIPGWQFFFRSSKMFYYILAYVVSHSPIMQILLYVMCHFSLDAFKIFFSLFWFSAVWLLCVWTWFSCSLSFLQYAVLLESINLCLSLNSRFFNYYSNIFYLQIFFLLPFRDSTDTNIRPFRLLASVHVFLSVILII